VSRDKIDPQKYRRSIRLPNYDYSRAGAYFVTIVTCRRESLFGEVLDGEMRLNKPGQIVQWEWLDLPKRLSYVELGAYIVMPNHFHGILILHENAGATRQELTGTAEDRIYSPHKSVEAMIGSPIPHGPKRASLGAVIAQFKSRITKRLWKNLSLKGTPIWQRNYYEHIIRNDEDLHNKTDYIESNPMLWHQDDENPLKIKG
jgi:REP element-mobilizing transposase RayT